MWRSTSSTGNSCRACASGSQSRSAVRVTRRRPDVSAAGTTAGAIPPQGPGQQYPPPGQPPGQYPPPGPPPQYPPQGPGQQYPPPGQPPGQYPPPGGSLSTPPPGQPPGQYPPPGQPRYPPPGQPQGQYPPSGPPPQYPPQGPGQQYPPPGQPPGQYPAPGPPPTHTASGPRADASTRAHRLRAWRLASVTDHRRRAEAVDLLRVGLRAGEGRAARREERSGGQGDAQSRADQAKVDADNGTLDARIETKVKKVKCTRCGSSR